MPGSAPAGVTGFNEPIVGRRRHTLPATQHDIVIWLTGSGYDVVFDLSRAVVMALAGVGRPRERDRRLAVPPRPGPDGLHRRHGEPDARRGDRGRPHPGRRARRRRVGAPAAAVGARRDRLGDAAGVRPGGHHRAAQGGQRRARSEAADLARQPDRPGPLREDLPAQHRLRDADPPRHDLRRLLPRPADPPTDAREHGRARTADRRIA